MNILCVGDGDFSFSLGLARHLCSGKAGYFSSDNNNNTRIVATSYEKKSTLQKVYSSSFDETLRELESLGVTIAFEVDATRIQETLTSSLPNILKQMGFHRVIWNFPCTAISNGRDGQNQQMEDNKRLLQGFVKSARSILSRGDGELYMAHKTKPPYNQWNIEEIALSEQVQETVHGGNESSSPLLHYSGRLVMDRFLIPPYTPRKALDRKSFPCHDACFYIFAQDCHEKQLPNNVTNLFPPTIPNVKVKQDLSQTQQSNDTLDGSKTSCVLSVHGSPSVTTTSNENLVSVHHDLILSIRSHHMCL
jgi:hypothetical protein